MTTFLVILHVLVCFALILVVLLQAGKGSDIGATFGGGGSQTVFGSRGAGNFLTKMTAIAGALFMLTSLTLALTASRGTASSVVKEPAGKEAPASPAPKEGAPFAPAQGAPAPADTAPAGQPKPVQPGK